jgi:hypothetical protein
MTEPMHKLPRLRDDDTGDDDEKTRAIPTRANDEDDERTTNVMRGRRAQAFREKMGLRPGKPLTRIQSAPDSDEMATVVKPTPRVDVVPIEDEAATVIKLTPQSANPATDTMVIPQLPAQLPPPPASHPGGHPRAPADSMRATRVDMSAPEIDRTRTLINVGIAVIVVLLVLIAGLALAR